MINFGKKPNDNLGSSVNTANFKPLDCSGIFLLQIAQATHYSGIGQDKKDEQGHVVKKGKPYENVSINAVVLNPATKEPVRSCSFSVFLSSTSQELQDLLFFTQQFDAEGNIVLDDFVTKTGNKKDGSGEYCIEEYKQFQGKKIIAMLNFTGMSAKGNPIFDKVSFVSKTGQSAAEFNAQLQANKHLTAWNAMTSNGMNYLDPVNCSKLFDPTWVPPQKQQQQAYGQQYAQPQQTGYQQQPVYGQAPVQQTQPPVRQVPQGVVQQVQQMNALQGATVQKADDDLPF